MTNMTAAIFKRPSLTFVAVALLLAGHSPTVVDSVETEFICEHTTKTLTCPAPGMTMTVSYANYGRTGHSVCSSFTGAMHKSRRRVNNCYDESHTALVGRLCNGRRSCSVVAMSRIFGNPCPGIRKYLQVDYTCD